MDTLNSVMHAIQMQNETAFTNPSAPPGKSQQYAKPERERRFLLAEMPMGDIEKTAKITDRYFFGHAAASAADDRDLG